MHACEIKQIFVIKCVSVSVLELAQILLLLASTYNSFLLQMAGEFLFHYIRVSHQNFDDGLRESLHVSFPDLRVRTFQLRHYVEALRQLCENVDDGDTEEYMFAALLEL